MTEAILRLSLTTDGGKWEPGTILGAYAIDQRFGPADMAGFKLVRINAPNHTLAELQAMRCYKVLDLRELTTPTELTAIIEQKELIHTARSENGVVHFVPSDVAIKPDLAKSKEKDLTKLKVKDAAEQYKPKPVEQPEFIEPEKVKVK